MSYSSVDVSSAPAIAGMGIRYHVASARGTYALINTPLRFPPATNLTLCQGTCRPPEASLHACSLQDAAIFKLIHVAERADVRSIYAASPDETVMHLFALSRADNLIQCFHVHVISDVQLIIKVSQETVQTLSSFSLCGMAPPSCNVVGIPKGTNDVVTAPSPPSGGASFLHPSSIVA